MASLGMDQWATMMAGIASGAMAGKQQAQQEDDANKQQQQSQLLQAIPNLLNAQTQQRNATMAPYDALSPYVNQMDPASKAQFLTGRAGAAGQQPPGLDWRKFGSGFPEDHPLHSVFMSMAGPGVVPPAVAGRMPGAAGPPPAGMTPPPSPGAMPPAIAPGGGGGPAISTPFGKFNLQGVSDKERAGLQQRVAQLDKQLAGASLNPQERQTLTERRQALNMNPQSPEEYRQAISELGGLETIAYGRSPAVTGEADRNATAQFTRHQQRFDRLTGANPKLGRMASGPAAQELVDLFDSEKKYRDSGMEERTGQVIRNLDGYQDDIEKIRAGLASSDPAARREAVTDATRIVDEIRSDKTPGQSLNEARAAMLVVGRLSPADAANPQKAAAALAAAGLPEVAARVKAGGVNFGGAAANRTLTELVRSVKDFQHADPAMRGFIADQIVGAARATGQKVQLNAADLQNFDPMQTLKLQQARQQVQINGNRMQKDALTLKTDQWKYDHMLPAQLAETQARTRETNGRANKLQAGTGAGGDKGKLTQGQLLNQFRAQEREAATTYQQASRLSGLLVADDYDPEKVAKTLPTDPATGRKVLPPKASVEQTLAAKWYDWQTARQKTQRVLKGMGYNFDDPSFMQNWEAGKTPAQQKNTSPAAGASPAAQPKVPAAAIPLQQQRQTYWSGLKKSGATDHEANVLMQHRFGASP